MRQSLARPIRKRHKGGLVFYHGKVLAGFAGSVADAFTLFEKFEGKLESYNGNLQRAAVELAKDWRTDRVLRKLEAQQQELLSEMEVLNGMIQQMIRQNAAVAQDQTEYNKRFDALSQKFKEAEGKKDAVVQQISNIRDRRGTMEDFLRILKQQDGEVTTFSEKLWCGLLDYATAYADGRLTFTFKNGSTFEG